MSVKYYLPRSSIKAIEKTIKNKLRKIMVRRVNRNCYYKNREERCLSAIEWQKSNPEKTKETAHRYYLKNKTQRYAKSKEWNQNNKDKINQYTSTYYEKNREIILMKAKAKNQENKLKKQEAKLLKQNEN